MKAFELFETTDGNYIPSVTKALCDELGPKIEPSHKASYWILGSRLFGLSYPNYLRYLRDEYGATLVGKVIPRFYFKEKKDCERVINELNKRFDYSRGESNV